MDDLIQNAIQNESGNLNPFIWIMVGVVLAIQIAEKLNMTPAKMKQAIKAKM